MSAALPEVLTGPPRRAVAGLFANGVAQAACGVAAAALVQQVFARLHEGQAVGPALPLALLGVGALLAALRQAELVRAERLGQAHANRVRQALFEHLARQPQRRVAARSRGATLLRFVGDAAALRRWIALGLPRLLVGGVSGLLGLGVLLAMQPLLGVAVAATQALTVGALVVAGGGVAGAVREARRRRAAMAAELGDRLAAMAVVQLFGQADREARRLQRRQQAMADAVVAQRRATARLAALSQAGAAAASAVVLGLGAWLHARGELTIAALAGAMTLVGLVAPAFGGLGRVMGHWHAAKVARTRLAALLAQPVLSVAAPTEATDERQVPLPGGAVRVALENLTLDGVLHGISAAVEPGQRVAIVGPNGAGKSSLLALVARLAEANVGEVRLDGQPLAAIPPERLRRMIGVASPDLPLLRGTLGRNLGYRRPRAGAAARRRVEAWCGVDDLLRQLPDGPATRLREGGANLSWGQRQRVAWARALLGGPGLLLLDEPDAHLDPAGEAHLDRLLERFPGTVLMVTHQLARVRTADLVWHLADGRLVEQGPPAHLLAGATRTRALFAPALRGQA